MARYKVFLDTNVILDLLLHREGMEATSSILKSLGKQDCVISVSSFYTAAYYSEIYLKRSNILGEQKMARLRQILNDLLDVVTVAGIDEDRLRTGINDQLFNDIEDSFQQQTAIAADCDIVITNNIKDFKNSNALPLMTPQEFLNFNINKE